MSAAGHFQSSCRDTVSLFHASCCATMTGSQAGIGVTLRMKGRDASANRQSKGWERVDSAQYAAGMRRSDALDRIFRFLARPARQADGDAAKTHGGQGGERV